MTSDDGVCSGQVCGPQRRLAGLAAAWRRRPRPAAGVARAVRKALAGAAVLSLVACSHLGPPSKVTLSETELQNLLQQRFPVEQRMLEVFEVRASSPKLRLLPERNRLQAVLDVQARERILQSRFGGRLDFDAALRWEAADQTVRLDQVRVQDFALEAPARPPAGAVQTAAEAVQAQPGMRRSGTERVAAALAERVLEGLVLYQLPAEKRAQLDKAGVQPAGLAITRGGLEITLEPKAK